MWPGRHGEPSGSGATWLRQSEAMTETVQRPSPPAPRPDVVPWRDAAVHGLRSAAVAATLSLLAVVLPVLLVWTADGRSGAGLADALRTGAQLWLVAHGAALDVPGGVVTLTPLGLLALPLWLLSRAGRHAERGAVARRVLFVVVPYAALAGAVSLVSSTGEVHAPAPGAVLSSAVVATAGVVLGARRHLAVPARLRRTAVPAAAATGVLLGAGALVVAVRLGLQLSRAADLAGTTAPGAVGGLGLLVAGLLLLPNAVVCGAAWLAGPGFAIGAGTAVGPYGVDVGNVPALPLLAALPSGAAPGWAGPLALLVPLLAGALAGRLVQRSLPEAGLPRLVAEAGLAALLTAGTLALLSGLAAGAVGGGRLVEVGPAPMSVGLAVLAAVGAGAAVSAAVHRVRARP